MAKPITNNVAVNDEIHRLDDQRRRLGIASLRAKITAAKVMLEHANKLAAEAEKSYEDPAASDAHLYTCIESVNVGLLEVADNVVTALSLCPKIIGDNTVPPIEKFSSTVRQDNGII